MQQNGFYTRFADDSTSDQQEQTMQALRKTFGSSTNDTRVRRTGDSGYAAKYGEVLFSEFDRVVPGLGPNDSVDPDPIDISKASRLCFSNHTDPSMVWGAFRRAGWLAGSMVAETFTS
jgi:hypothetical protein